MGESKQATIYFETHIHRRLKVRAAQEGKTVSALVTEAVQGLLDGPQERPDTRIRLGMEWAGALADLKDETTSLGLQEWGKQVRGE